MSYKNIVERKKKLKKQKEDWLYKIKLNIQQIEGYLGKMEDEGKFILKRDAHGYFYPNNTLDDMGHNLKEIKEIFDEAEDVESSLEMDESDAAIDEKSASINWDSYQKTIGG